MQASCCWLPKEFVKELPVEIVDGAHHFVREEHVVFVPTPIFLTGCIQVHLVAIMSSV